MITHIMARPRKGGCVSKKYANTKPIEAPTMVPKTRPVPSLNEFVTVFCMAKIVPKMA